MNQMNIPALQRNLINNKKMYLKNSQQKNFNKSLWKMVADKMIIMKTHSNRNSRYRTKMKSKILRNKKKMITSNQKSKMKKVTNTKKKRKKKKLKKNKKKKNKKQQKMVKAKMKNKTKVSKLVLKNKQIMMRMFKSRQLKLKIM